MKRLLFFLVAVFPLATFAQSPQPFNVTGKLGSLNTKLYLAYQLGSNKVLDSAQCVNGAFEFKGDLIYPSLALLIADYKGVGAANVDVANGDKMIFYIDKGTTTLQSPDSVHTARLINSAINEQYKKLLAISEDASAKTNKLMTDELKTATDQKPSADQQNQLQAKLKVIQTAYHDALKTFIIQNPNSYLSLLTLGSLGGPSPDPNEILPLLNGLSPELQQTETARNMKNSLESLKSTENGAIAPDFEQRDTTGHLVRLSSFRGKYVLLDFWASWCGPCRQESPNLVNTFNRFKDKNFTIVSVSLDKPDGGFSWMNAIRMDHLSGWTHLSDLKFWQNAVAQLYFVQVLPKNFLIDPTGKIIAQDLRGDDLTTKLEELLGK